MVSWVGAEKCSEAGAPPVQVGGAPTLLHKRGVLETPPAHPLDGDAGQGGRDASSAATVVITKDA